LKPRKTARPVKRDDLTQALENLSGGSPSPRLNLSEQDKAELVERLGPRLARDIVKAKKDYPLKRIPFLFSTVNTQDVVDVLNNDVDAAIAAALAKRSRHSP
jgi:hypothetical protein